MTKRVLLLPAALFMAANLALAQTYHDVTVTGNVNTVEPVAGIHAGVVLNGEFSTAPDGVTVAATPNSVPYNTYDLAGAIMTNIMGGTNRSIAVITTDSTGFFGLNHIGIAGNTTSDVSGFVYTNDTPFAGEIDAFNKNIFVYNASGIAMGVSFTNAFGTAPTDIASGKPISFGDIFAVGTTGAAGFAAGASNAAINLGEVTAAADAGVIKGVFLAGNVTGTLTTERVEAIATGTGASSAFGIQIGDSDPGAPKRGNLLSDLTVKDGITAEARDQAYGVMVNSLVSDNNVLIQNGTNPAIAVSGNDGAVAFGVGGIANSSINIGDIRAQSAGGFAHGFFSYTTGVDANSASGGAVTLGSINVNGNTEAAGVRFGSSHLPDGTPVGNVIVTGELTTGAINVHSAAGDAIGVHVVAGQAGTADTNGGLNTGANTNIGTINATSTDGQAFGMWVAGDSEFTLRNDITAESASGTAPLAGSYHAYGVLAERGNAHITIDGTVNVKANATHANGSAVGFLASENLTLNLADAHLTTNSVNVGRDLTVVGNGCADLGVITMGTGNFNIGREINPTATTVVFDVANSKIRDANVKLYDQITLEVYGEEYAPGQVKATGTFHNGLVSFVNSAVFTEWELATTGINAWEIVNRGARRQASMNDGYLAASQIHHRLTAWNAVRDHMISGVAMLRHGYLGQTCSPGFVFNSRNTWANYVGRDSQYQSSFNGRDWKFGTNGLQLGTDFFRNPRGQLGIFFGYEDSVGSNVGDRLNANDYYVGMYGVNVFRNGMDLRTVFAFGWQDYTSQRRGADGDLYSMKFRGNTAELNIDLGRRYYERRWSTRPSIGLDWYLNQLNGGHETAAGGGTEAIRYNTADFSQLFFRFGSDLRYECGPLMFDAGMYYSYDMLGNNLWSGVSNMDRTLSSTLRSSKMGRSIVSYNLGASWMLNPHVSLFGGYRGEYAAEKAGSGITHIGHFGGALRW